MYASCIQYCIRHVIYHRLITSREGEEGGRDGAATCSLHSAAATPVAPGMAVVKELGDKRLEIDLLHMDRAYEKRSNL